MKALEILCHLLSTAGASNKKELHEAIVELEEAMKPKSCEICKYFMEIVEIKDITKIERYCTIGVFSEFFANTKNKLPFYCNRYELKEMQ